VVEVLIPERGSTLVREEPEMAAIVEIFQSGTKWQARCRTCPFRTEWVEQESEVVAAANEHSREESHPTGPKYPHVQVKLYRLLARGQKDPRDIVGLVARSLRQAGVKEVAVMEFEMEALNSGSSAEDVIRTCMRWVAVRR
jgi:hypothetical protein